MLIRFTLWCLTFYLFFGMFAASAQEPTLVMSRAPRECGLDIEKGLYFASTSDTLHAYDIDSGIEKWSYSIGPDHEYLHAQQAKDTMVLVYSHGKASEILGIDPVAGTVKWKETPHTRETFAGVLVWPDSSWFFQGYSVPTRRGSDRDVYWVVCGPDGSPRHKLPLNKRPLRWHEEGKTLLLLSEKQVFLWDLDAQQLREYGAFARGSVSDYLADGRCLLMEKLSEAETQYQYTIADTITGKVLRTVTLPGSECKFFHDGQTLLLFDREEEVVRLLDADTDEIRITLQAPGHIFLPKTFREDLTGSVWILSRDESEHRYLWPVEPNATPRLIFDGSRYLVGVPIEIRPPYVLTRTTSHDAPNTVRAYDFEQRVLVAEWRQSTVYPMYPVIVCDAMKRCALAHGESSFEVLEKGVDTPLLSIQGSLEAFSPSGEHAVARTGKNEVRLLRVSTGDTLVTFSLAYLMKDYLSAVFSQDGRFIATNDGYNHYMVSHLYADTPVHLPLEIHASAWFLSQSFSPNGMRLLSTGSGRAWLHDTYTGRLLHTLKEPQQFRSDHYRVPEVMGFKMPIINYLGDLAGNFTNLANSEPTLRGAFIGDGSQILTVAESQMIRVWDRRTGRSLRTMTPALSNKRDENGDMENRITLSRNGAYALCLNPNDGDASLWDVSTGKEIRRFRNWQREYGNEYVSNDGRHVYFTCYDSVYRYDKRQETKQRL